MWAVPAHLLGDNIWQKTEMEIGRQGNKEGLQGLLDLDLHCGSKTNHYLCCLSLVPRFKLQTSRVELWRLQRITYLGITGALNTAPLAALEVILGLCLLLLFGAESHAGTHRFTSSELMRPRVRTCSHYVSCCGHNKELSRIIWNLLHALPMTVTAMFSVVSSGDWNLQSELTLGLNVSWEMSCVSVEVQRFRDVYTI
jgi:hypothetical protein